MEQELTYESETKDIVEGVIRNTVYKVLNEMYTEEPLETLPDGLEDTPKRVAKYFRNYLMSEFESEPVVTKFPTNGEYNDLILVDEIDFASTCEHHFLPIIGNAHIAYIPNEYYSGLSKFARVVDYFARRPQVQERMTHQVIEYLNKELKPQGIMVMVEATHTCMTIRGVKKRNSVTTTSAIRGDIPKSEVLDLIKSRRL